MAILLVRHAKAGNRERWDAPDDLRPLTPKGVAQAEALVALLADFAVERILSSPYVRCMQTVEPLAAARGLVVEPCDDLAEGAGAAARALVHGLAGDAGNVVLCTHGDVVYEVVAGLGVNGEIPMKKGSTWVLETKGGRVVDALYLDPPA